MRKTFNACLQLIVVDVRSARGVFVRKTEDLRPEVVWVVTQRIALRDVPPKISGNFRCQRVITCAYSIRKSRLGLRSADAPLRACLITALAR